MTAPRRSIVAVAVALLVPFLLIGNGFHVLVHDWFVQHEYGRDGFPADPEGMETEERTRLALLGLRSIVPWEREGPALLEEARLDDGSLAFTAREVRHMDDVRTLLGILLALHAVALVTFVVLGVVRATRPALRRGLQAGAAAMLVISAIVGVMIALDAEGFLDGFHAVFFEGSTWRFDDKDTLIRLYPDPFWEDTAAIIGVAVAVQAAILLVAASWPELRRATGRLRAR